VNGEAPAHWGLLRQQQTNILFTRSQFRNMFRHTTHIIIRESHSSYLNAVQWSTVCDGTCGVVPKHVAELKTYEEYTANVKLVLQIYLSCDARYIQF
jgi:hypothetical protein